MRSRLSSNWMTPIMSSLQDKAARIERMADSKERRYDDDILAKKMRKGILFLWLREWKHATSKIRNLLVWTNWIRGTLIFIYKAWSTVFIILLSHDSHCFDTESLATWSLRPPLQKWCFLYCLSPRLAHWDSLPSIEIEKEQNQL